MPMRATTISEACIEASMAESTPPAASICFLSLSRALVSAFAPYSFLSCAMRRLAGSWPRSSREIALAMAVLACSKGSIPFPARRLMIW